MVVDEPDEAFDVGVRGVVALRGVALDDPDGVYHDVEGGASSVEESPVEELAGLVSAVFDVEFDRGDRGVGDSAEQLVVVDAQQGDLLGDADSGHLAGLGDEQGVRVVAAEECDGFGQGV